MPDIKVSCKACGGPLKPSPAGYVRGAAPSITTQQMICEQCGLPHSVKNEDGMARAKSQERQFDVAGDRNELLEKLRRLDERLADVEGMRKTAAKDYGDQIKDVKAERVAVMKALKDAPATPEV